jgi:hypothetical protein
MVQAAPTQSFVPIREIRDGVVVLQNGELRTVLLASALNLGLKSGEEQKATVSQFQNFLNSIDFPLQIVSSSRRLDIRPYILTLESRLEQIPEELLRLQTREYIDFIRNFNETYNIMSKFFYVVVPFTPALVSGNSVSKGIGSFITAFSTSKTTSGTIDATSFEENRSQLEQRVAIISQGLASCGIETRGLNTEALTELYHTYFNPGELHAAVKE